jgi:hypothetical protein
MELHKQELMMLAGGCNRCSGTAKIKQTRLNVKIPSPDCRIMKQSQNDDHSWLGGLALDLDKALLCRKDFCRWDSPKN